MTPWTGGLPALWGGQGGPRWAASNKGRPVAEGHRACCRRRAEGPPALRCGKRVPWRAQKSSPHARGNGLCPHVLPAERGPGGHPLDPLDRRTARLRRAGGARWTASNKGRPVAEGHRACCRRRAEGPPALRCGKRGPWRMKKKTTTLPAGTASATHLLPAERGPGGHPLDPLGSPVLPSSSTCQSTSYVSFSQM